MWWGLRHMLALGSQRQDVQGVARSHPHPFPSLGYIGKEKRGWTASQLLWVEWALLTSPGSPHGLVTAGLGFSCSDPELWAPLRLAG